MRRHGWILTIACLVMAGLVFSAAAVRAAEPGQGPAARKDPGRAARYMIRQLDPRGIAAAQYVAALAPEEGEVKFGEHWIGVVLQNVPEEVRAQVSLPKGQGVTISEVVPDSPAAAAKLRRFDIVVKVDGKPLTSGQVLVDAVGAAKDKKLTLEILREGKTLKVDVTPAKRPADFAAKTPEGLSEYQTPNEAFRKWFDDHLRGGGKPDILRLFQMQPGYLLRKAGFLSAPLPGNLSIAITKQGDQPAKIAVTQGDKKWEIAENELDKLPADVRPHVERMLGHTPLRFGLQPYGGDRGLQFIVPEDARPARPERRAEPAPQARLEKRLDEMSRQLEQLRKAVDEIRGQRPGAKGEGQKPATKDAPARKGEKV